MRSVNVGSMAEGSTAVWIRIGRTDRHICARYEVRFP